MHSISKFSHLGSRSPHVILLVVFFVFYSAVRKKKNSLEKEGRALRVDVRGADKSVGYTQLLHRLCIKLHVAYVQCTSRRKALQSSDSVTSNIFYTTQKGPKRPVPDESLMNPHPIHSGKFRSSGNPGDSVL
ncbi:hypothetical protein OUZ56_008453 [Daphnia magna]|uniref:Uncharacterized protein n=1 Tax=Daphnia magna TaxID=35525 RepID=A0ABR0AD09_9CRUS|nr:hypothetical protein OUZ56_008453 [Daphnia magna]